MVKFNKHHVVNTATKAKARVCYSLDNRTDGRKCVTMYAKDYSNALHLIFADAYKNDSDLHTDYFDKGKAVLFEDHPLYREARAAVEARRT